MVRSAKWFVKFPIMSVALTRVVLIGNMVLQLDNSSTCLIVKQYLDRCRNTVRRELMDKFRSSFANESSTISPKVE